MTYHWYDFAGNVGVVIILLAYLLLQMQKLRIEDWRYSLVNALGAGLILISLYFAFNLSAFLIEAAWLVISLYGLARAYAARRSSGP